MPFAALQTQAARQWLEENGPRELESLSRAIIYHFSSVPILIADNLRLNQEASCGAARLLAVPRDKIIGKRLDDFVAPSIKPNLAELWQSFLQQGEQTGTLDLVRPDGRSQEVEYAAKRGVLPARHVLVFRDKIEAGKPSQAEIGESPSWIQDFALFLLNLKGEIAEWYAITRFA